MLRLLCRIRKPISRPAAARAVAVMKSINNADFYFLKFELIKCDSTNLFVLLLTSRQQFLILFLLSKIIKNVGNHACKSLALNCGWRGRQTAGCYQHTLSVFDRHNTKAQMIIIQK